jgi:polyisoprenoid-binding protein YceI
MKFSKLFSFFFLSLFLLSGLSYGATYDLDVDHTTVGFKIKHLLSWTKGQFNEFKGTFEYDPEKPEASKVEAAVKVGSIDTNVPQRDTHLKSKDFFDAEQFPEMTFKSTKFTPEGKDKAKLEGLLTIHGVEKPVVFDVDVLGVAKDPWGNVRAAFTAETKINRKDFGLGWNKTLETGQFLVGEEVTITLEVEGIQTEKPAAA